MAARVLQARRRTKYSFEHFWRNDAMCERLQQQGARLRSAPQVARLCQRVHPQDELVRS